MAEKCEYKRTREFLVCSCVLLGWFKYVLGCWGPLRRALTFHPERACHHFSVSGETRHLSSKYLLNIPRVLCLLGRAGEEPFQGKELLPGEFLQGSSARLLKLQHLLHMVIDSGPFLLVTDFWREAFLHVRGGTAFCKAL